MIRRFPGTHPTGDPIPRGQNRDEATCREHRRQMPIHHELEDAVGRPPLESGELGGTILGGSATSQWSRRGDSKD